MVASILMWSLSDASATSRVCTIGDYDTACDYYDLSFALLFDTDLELAPGTHRMTSTGVLVEPQSRIVALPGAVIEDPGFVVLIVESTATDSVLEDLVFVDGPGRISGGDGGLIRVRSDGFTATNLDFDSIEMDFSDLESVVTITDARDVLLDGLTASGDTNRALVEVRGAEVVLDTPRIDLFTTTMAPLLVFDDSTVDVLGGHIKGSVGFFGDAVYSDKSDVHLDGVSLEGGAGFGAGLVQAVGGTLTVDGSTLSSPEGGIYGIDTALVLTDGASEVTITATTFEDRSMPAVLVTDADKLDVVDVVFGGGAGVGPGIEVVGVDEVSVASSWFCNPGGLDGSAIRLEASCDGGCALDRVVVADATASGAGSVWVNRGLLEITNSSFVGNHAVLDGGAIEAANSAQLDLRRNLVIDQSGGGAAVAGELVAFIDNAFGNNRAEDLSGPWPDPDRNLRNLAAVLDREPGDPCLSAVRIADDPANDWLVEHRVGAFTPCRADIDGDGFGSDWISDGSLDCDLPGEALASGDCDDSDVGRFPGARDEWYDGIDSDCAGNDDFDQDGDGLPLDEDCDDGNAAACEETTRRLLGGACSTGGPGATGGWVFAALALAALGRARKASFPAAG